MSMRKDGTFNPMQKHKIHNANLQRGAYYYYYYYYYL